MYFVQTSMNAAPLQLFVTLMLTASTISALQIIVHAKPASVEMEGIALVSTSDLDKLKRRSPYRPLSSKIVWR